jgi:CheY-like chemotaxis protein
MATDTCPATVLIIEDDERLAEAIASFLEDREYPTVLARDCEHALELLGIMDHPCLVLLDPLSANLDYAKVLAALQPADRLATIPVVLVSIRVPALLTRPASVRRLNDLEILFHIVQQHCCGGTRGGGAPRGGKRAPLDGGVDR